MKDYITAKSNTKVHFLTNDIDLSEILLSDIFYGLARLPRFNATTKRLYSVGEHSIYVADQMRGDQALVGLLHDAAEYVFNDLASPIVAHIPQYKEMRDMFQDAIYEKFLGDLYRKLPEILPKLKEIDVNMCATEQLFLKEHEPTLGTVIQGIDLTKCPSPLDVELILFRKYHHYLELASA